LRRYNVEIGILHMLNTKCDSRDEHHLVRMMDHFVHRSHLCIVFEVWWCRLTLSRPVLKPPMVSALGARM
jgi:hypothetical protein